MQYLFNFMRLLIHVAELSIVFNYKPVFVVKLRRLPKSQLSQAKYFDFSPTVKRVRFMHNFISMSKTIKAKTTKQRNSKLNFARYVRAAEKAFLGELSIAFGGEKQSSKVSETRNKSNQKWEE